MESSKSSLMLQIWGSVQHTGVQALATLDERLEQTPLLEELDPNEMPDEVTDRDGNMTQDCSEVRVMHVSSLMKRKRESLRLSAIIMGAS